MHARKKILSGGSVFVNAQAAFDGAPPSPGLVVSTLIISRLIVSTRTILTRIVSIRTMLQRSTGPAGRALGAGRGRMRVCADINGAGGHRGDGSLRVSLPSGA